MAECEIIIVKYGLPELEQECIDSVLEHTGDVDYHLTVWDNYELDEGLAKVWNDRIRETDAEFICLLNNDTRVEKGWLRKLLECFEEDEKLGAIGPMTNAATGPQGNRRNRTATKRLLDTRYPLVGFCLVFPRRLWEDIGGFDEEYEIYGEDSDFCMEVRERGYKWRIRTDVFIFHHGKSSTPIAIARGKDLLKLKKESKARFIKKWKTGELTPAQQEVKRQKEAEEARRIEQRGAISERAKARQASRKEAKAAAAKQSPRGSGPSVTAAKMRMHKEKARGAARDAKLTERQKQRQRYLQWKAERKK